MKKLTIFLTILLVVILFVACQSQTVAENKLNVSNQPASNIDLPKEVHTIPSVASDVSPTIGPLNYPVGINPLTGLPVQNTENLKFSPMLVSISNFPASGRPQAGLSFSPIVFELYIGGGETRNLAVFYGDFPQRQINNQKGSGDPSSLSEAKIGPIRSGRLPYESIRKLFDGQLLMASAMKSVAKQTNEYVNIFGSDQMDANSALISVSQMMQYAQSKKHDPNSGALSGMYFNAQLPEGGKDAPSLWMCYAYLNQIFWRYNAQDGSYHRIQDNADGSTFIEAVDRLNGIPLKYANIIVLFVDHIVKSRYSFDLDLLFQKREEALLFRDGKMYKIYWTTRSEEYEQATGKLRPIRFIDYEGNPFPFKPGRTWIEIVPQYTPFWETVNSEKYHQLMAGRSLGSGLSLIHI